MSAGSLIETRAEVLENRDCGHGQFVLRLQAPVVAERAEPGQFVHLRCAPDLPMRRPLSIMRADARGGWIELLYKRLGRGTRALAERKPGERLPLLGPVGQPFRVAPDTRRALLIGGGVGMPPMLFLAERLHKLGAAARPWVALGSELPFPFRPVPSTLLLPGTPAAAIGAMPLLEDWGVPSRLASGAGLPGCFDGHVTELARGWLQALAPVERAQTELLACGPEPMLRATARLAADFALPAQLCLEEYMACALGGCAGCVVQVHTEAGPAMRRVCVDGPVFPAAAIYPDISTEARAG